MARPIPKNLGEVLPSRYQFSIRRRDFVFKYPVSIPGHLDETSRAIPTRSRIANSNDFRNFQFLSWKPTTKNFVNLGLIEPVTGSIFNFVVLCAATELDRKKGESPPIRESIRRSCCLSAPSSRTSACSSTPMTRPTSKPV